MNVGTHASSFIELERGGHMRSITDQHTRMHQMSCKQKEVDGKISNRQTLASR
eukprot:GDKH01022892.1.p2 GENE.GDKH01022892.1~~GDKH01022892.1.p2  ORF type:complete len:53 (-),score=3.27 GDKH01022892.1:5-163(-)